MRTVLVSAVLLCLMAASPLYAYVINESDSLSFATTNWTRLFEVPQFDPNLAPLLRVTITYTGYLDSTLQFENLSTETGSTGVRASTQVDFDLYRAGSATNVMHSQSLNASAGPINLGRYDGVTDYAGLSGATFANLTDTGTFSTVLTNPVDIAPFVGNGTVTFQLTANASNSSSYNGGIVITPGINLARGDIDVEYQYVPEPGTYAMFGLGLFGLFGLAWTRRKTAAEVA